MPVQTGAQTLAQKAHVFGFGVRIRDRSGAEQGRYEYIEGWSKALERQTRERESRKEVEATVEFDMKIK